METVNPSFDRDISDLTIGWEKAITFPHTGLRIALREWTSPSLLTSSNTLLLGIL